MAGRNSTHRRRTGARWGPGACPDVATVIWTAIWYTKLPPRQSKKTATLGLRQRILYPQWERCSEWSIQHPRHSLRNGLDLVSNLKAGAGNWRTHRRNFVHIGKPNAAYIRRDL